MCFWIKNVYGIEDLNIKIHYGPHAVSVIFKKHLSLRGRTCSQRKQQRKHSFFRHTKKAYLLTPKTQ